MRGSVSKFPRASLGTQAIVCKLIPYFVLRLRFIRTEFYWILKFPYCHKFDQLFGLVVSTSDCHPRNFSGSIGSGTGSTHLREDNWVATLCEK